MFDADYICVAYMHTDIIYKYINIHSYIHTKEEHVLILISHSKTFYLRLYGVEYMVKDHSDSEREKPLPHYMDYSSD